MAPPHRLPHFEKADVRKIPKGRNSIAITRVAEADAIVAFAAPLRTPCTLIIMCVTVSIAFMANPVSLGGELVIICVEDLHGSSGSGCKVVWLLRPCARASSSNFTTFGVCFTNSRARHGRRRRDRSRLAGPRRLRSRIGARYAPYIGRSHRFRDRYGVRARCYRGLYRTCVSELFAA
jgi:hypothetical protein